MSPPHEVINGKWGNREERHARLTSAGYKYDMIQTLVYRLLRAAPIPAKESPQPNIDALAHAVIRGDYGNREERQARLGNLYDQAQAHENAKLDY